MAHSSWYQPTADAAGVPPQVAERAVEWLLELQTQPLAPATLEAWEAWRRAHPDHERAWRRIESVRGRLQGLASPVNAAIAQAALTPAPSGNRRQAIKTLALLVVGGSVAWGLSRTEPWQQWRADLRTGIGQQRRLVLEDGSQLALNTDTTVNLAFSAEERRLRLISGELLVTTGKAGGGRPFLVETAQGLAYALGTRYAVRQREGRTEVSVWEGAVRLVPRQAAQEVLVLQAGQQAAFSAQGVGDVTTADETRMAWTDGVIVARGMRLDAFLAELGRYTTDRLNCAPSVGGVRISGSYPVADSDAVIATLAAALGLQAQLRQRFWGGRQWYLAPSPDAF
ncbi:FecR domain-containing protein [Herbaspirillum camelliae]|uniref:FecR domain-containing protein n=1 Tax=Herbaspirillum camelliae TaxID=1892903 RepID=UPI00094A0A8B|nr:FecR domain-containing protein [Herbaspirillum camelliae]